MIGCIFQFASEYIEVRIVGTQLLFRTAQTGGFFGDVNSLKLDYEGTVLEFPDLKENEEWEKIAIERLKEKIKSLNTEEERMNYVILELKRKGYVPLFTQKSGFRTKKYLEGDSEI